MLFRLPGVDLGAGEGPLRVEQQTLLADKLSIDESRAQEITTFLRPNPTLSLTIDGTQIAPERGVWRMGLSLIGCTYETPGIQLSAGAAAQAATATGERQEGDADCRRSRHADMEKNDAVHLAQRFCVIHAAGESGAATGERTILNTTTTCWISAEPVIGAGDIAQIDLDRLELAAGAI